MRLGKKSLIVLVTLVFLVNFVSAQVPGDSVYFVHTQTGNFDKTLDEIIGSSHEFADVNFKEVEFKVYTDARLLSRMNYVVNVGGQLTVRQSYEPYDITVDQDPDSFARIVNIDRQSRESTANPVVPDSVFEENLINEATLLSGGSFLDFSSESGDTYVFKNEQRDRWVVEGSGAGTMHSSRAESWNSLVDAPTFTGYPWASDGYENTYGNGVYIYVDDDGELHVRYETRTSPSRAIFAVGIMIGNSVVSCGDGTCNSMEDCSNCAVDCGTCATGLPELPAGAIPISTCDELQNKIEDDSCASGNYYYLTQDIECAGYDSGDGKGFMPICFDSTYPLDLNTYFQGTLDGRGNLIKDLSFDRPSLEFGGVFGTIGSNGVVQYLGFENIDLSVNSAERSLGGVVHLLSSGTIREVFVKGNINGGYRTQSGGRYSHVGGIVAHCSGLIENAYTEVDLESNCNQAILYNNDFTGGVAGTILGGCQLTNVYSSSDVCGYYNVGGIYGTNTNFGGVFGTTSSTYYNDDMELIGNNLRQTGDARSDSEMKQEATFVGWDFTDVWKIDESNDYPRFRWETTIPVGPVCGNSNCESPSENSDNCENDCPVDCGDGYCDLDDEDCSSCEADCGACAPYVEPCGTAENTILKLFSVSNSHAEIYTESNYNEGICFNEIFVDPIPTTPHPTCDASNAMLWLSANTNTQVSTTSDATYNIPVCYSDLICHSADENSGESCDADEEIVARLSQPTNSHISKASDTNAPILICCEYSTAPPIVPNDLYWANMDGVPIDEADLEDSVFLVANVPDFAGKSISYEIYQKEYLLGLPLRWNLLDLLNPDSQIASGVGVGKTIWKAGDGGGEFSEGEYYFIATSEDGDSYSSKDADDYGILDVSADRDNSYPNTEIIKPIAESDFIIENTGSTVDIDFEQISLDEDDDLRLTWDFDDGNQEVFEDVKINNIGNTTHAYTSSGTKIVTLNAEEMDRGQSVNDASRIYIHKPGMHIFAIIDSPDYDALVGAGLYELNGTSSYVEECFVNQLACPPLGVNKPCYEVTDIQTGNKLYCYNVVDSSGLTFEWKIDGVVEAGVTNNAVFEHLFYEPRQHNIDLKVVYDY
ncbi:hypothetical protein HOD75_02065 [archaeon]|jgi:hypothetical protein|nr:hypothetical protein [archaeon]MBT4241662.1 hypothetical protein [archaeon]MBT4418057.1 hypothetical protein [archaeon]